MSELNEENKFRDAVLLSLNGASVAGALKALASAISVLSGLNGLSDGVTLETAVPDPAVMPGSIGIKKSNETTTLVA